MTFRLVFRLIFRHQYYSSWRDEAGSVFSTIHLCISFLIANFQCLLWARKNYCLINERKYKFYLTFSSLISPDIAYPARFRCLWNIWICRFAVYRFIISSTKAHASLGIIPSGEYYTSGSRDVDIFNRNLDTLLFHGSLYVKASSTLLVLKSFREGYDRIRIGFRSKKHTLLRIPLVCPFKIKFCKENLVSWNPHGRNQRSLLHQT